MRNAFWNGHFFCHEECHAYDEKICHSRGWLYLRFLATFFTKLVFSPIHVCLHTLSLSPVVELMSRSPQLKLFLDFFQSCSKPFTYAVSLNELGADVVHQYIGQEPSGRMFNELCLDYSNKVSRSTSSLIFLCRVLTAICSICISISGLNICR